MQEHPDVQMKAQKEIDSLVGQQRLPVLSDRESLPYITALCKELLRYHPPTPGGTALLPMISSSLVKDLCRCPAFCIRGLNSRRLLHTQRCYSVAKCLVSVR